MKILVGLIISLAFTAQVSVAQSSEYFIDVSNTKKGIKNSQGYTPVPINYWRHDTCVFSKDICKYNSSTAGLVKVIKNENFIAFELLRGNNSGYQSKIPLDTFRYIFVKDNINQSLLIRKLLIRDKYVRIDTFDLTVIDTIFFSNYSLIKNVFRKPDAIKRKTLKVYVLKSVDEFGSLMYHFWVEQIGIIKLTDEKCWRYSFEMKDDRSKSIRKMFVELIRIIKVKYKDPHWLSQPCGFE